MTNGIFLNIEDYIFFTSISIVCCRKFELRHIAKLTNAAVIGIFESKLDVTSEIQIDEYDLLRCDKNRHGGGVAR